MNREHWRWVSEDGTQHSLSEEQLISGLSSEQIPVFTLVWREGWGEWLPAMQVAELSWALPAGKADNPRKPSTGTGRQPAPDLSAYRELRERAALIERGGLERPSYRPARPEHQAAADVRGPALGLPPLRQPNIRVDDPPNDPLWEDPDDDAATVVRNPLLDDVPALAPLAPAALPLPAAPPAPPVLAPPTLARPAGTSREGPSPVFPSRPPPPPLPPLVSAHARVVTPPSAGTVVGPSSSAPRRQRAWLLPSFVILCAGIVTAVLIARNRPDVLTPLGVAPTPQPSSTPSRAAPASPDNPSDVPSPKTGEAAPLCSVQRGPRQLAEWVLPKVRPAFAELPEDRLAIAYAQTIFYAIGTSVDLKTLDREYTFREYRKQSIASVVPVSDGQRVDVVTQRLPSDVVFATTLPGPTRRAIGQTQGAISIVAGNDVPKSLWPLPLGRTISVPAVARFADGSFALVLRLGGEWGSIHSGIIDPLGNRRSELVAVESAAGTLGDPSITVRDETTALAFAGRKPNELGWRIYAAQGTDTSPPARAEPLSLGNANATAPFIAALAERQFLLLWTESAPGRNRAKAAVLDAQFRLVGSPIELSTSDQYATSAGLWLHGKRALATYFVSSKGNTELWGSLLRCEF